MSDPNATIQVTDNTLLIDSQRALEQIKADEQDAEGAAAAKSAKQGGKGVGPVDFAWAQTSSDTDRERSSAGESAVEAALARFFGSVKIDSSRYSRDIGNVTREVIDRLAGTGARLDITIDIQATKPEGFNESEIRTIGENARVLKFDPSSGFEKS